ncbi:hypothetical protein C8J57DRAFT_1228598 [Mycena rebaudengoi]|nr:hypothetical protein C8J57DRAFT_1228598 [Mycena rebaudengoi]
MPGLPQFFFLFFFFFSDGVSACCSSTNRVFSRKDSAIVTGGPDSSCIYPRAGWYEEGRKAHGGPHFAYIYPGPEWEEEGRKAHGPEWQEEGRKAHVAGPVRALSCVHALLRRAHESRFFLLKTKATPQDKRRTMPVILEWVHTLFIEAAT